MEYVYHGSSGLYKVLVPQQAYDTGYEEGCKNAVYATTNQNMALAFALEQYQMGRAKLRES